MEIRSVEGKPKKLVGYAVKWDSASEGLSGWTEYVRKGAFSRSLQSNIDVLCLIDHMPDKVLGRRNANTLTVKEDDVGLYFECDLPDTSFSNDLAVSVVRGDYAGCSFGFRNTSSDWAYDDGTSDIIRYITDADLVDVSVTTRPAYPQTDVALRSRDKIVSDIELEVLQLQQNLVEKTL